MCYISSNENPKDIKLYVRSTRRSFKDRYYNHISSFTNTSKRNMTPLSKYFWKMEEEGKTPMVKWKILKQARTCKSFNEPCFLCLQEKICIIKFLNNSQLLNQRFETTVLCRHIKDLVLLSC